MPQPEEKKRIIYPRAVARFFLGYLKKHPLALLAVLGGVITMQAGNLAAPWFLRSILNTLATNEPSPEVMATIVPLIGAVALAWFVSWLGSRIEYLTNTFVQTRMMADMMTDSFHYLLGHSHNFFASRFAGSLTHRVNKVARSFEMLMDAMVLQFVPTFVLVAGAVTILYFQNNVLGIVLGVWSVVFVVFQVYVSSRLQPIRNQRAQAETAVTATLADSISNHTTSQMFSGVSHEVGLLRSVAETWRRATIRSWLADHHVWAVVGLFMTIIQILMLYLATLYWSRGLLTIGDFILIQSYLVMIFERLVYITRELRRFFDALADASEMVEILNIPHEIRDVSGAQTLAVTDAKIQFTDVGFQFHADKPVLAGFDLSIAGGEKVALVGPSGAGKSTITKLLLRLYDVEKGNIAIDGQNIAEVTQDSLRDAIAFVPQEPILFHRTLMENIRYGRRDAIDDEVIEAAKQAHCHEFISALPLRYETFVGERGIKLSGGERQRVAIARAILKNAPILVLDEATSSLDSESEHYIQDALAKLMANPASPDARPEGSREGKTVVVIAHRLSTIMKMDRIIVIDGGRVVATGTHSELLSQGGLYHKLWSIQAGGFLRDEDEAEQEVESELPLKDIEELEEK